MSLHTASMSMEEISEECTQLGQMIEQYMFHDPLKVFELGTQYVRIIEQKISEYSVVYPRHPKERIGMSGDKDLLLMKIDWIKEMHMQVVQNKISITSDQMINCYQLLLQITDWYVKEFVNKQDNSFKDVQDEIVLANKTIYYKNSSITIPPNKLSIKLQHLGIKGCNHFLKELLHKNIHTVNDLPKQLDEVYLLLTGVGPATVKKLWNQLNELFSVEVVTLASSDLTNTDQVIHFSGESIEYPRDIAKLLIQEKDFPHSTKTVAAMKESGILTYGDLPEHLVELNEIEGIGGIRIKHFFNEMRELMLRKSNEQILKKLTNDERMHYEKEQYTAWFLHIQDSNQFVKREKLPDRYVRILKKRYKALLVGKHVTLQQLGDSEGITRERVRQILNRGNRLVADKWKVYIQCVKEKLDVEGSILADRLLSVKYLSDYVMIQAFEVEDIYFHELESMRLLSRMNKKSIEKCMEELKKKFHESFDLLPIDDYTYETHCKEQAKRYCLPEAFIHMLTSQWVDWIDHERGILKNVSKAKIVEMVMLNYPEGIAIYKEEPHLNEEANEFMPGKFLGERDFTAVFSRDDVIDRLILWARGVYIHKDFIEADESWVRNIQKKARKIVLKKEFIHVRKLYEQIEGEAMKQHIPNEYALFSLMRLYDEKLLSLERFPMIHLLGEARVDNVQRVIEYMKGKDKSVTKEQLFGAFVEKRGWKEFTIDQILSDSPEIIQYKHGVYTLMDYYDWITEKQMKPFFTMVEQMLKKSVVVSVHSLFHRLRDIATTLHIDTAHLLYALLRQWNQMDATFERFPYIMSGNSSKESISNCMMIEAMIKDSCSIVTRKDMLLWLNTITPSSDSILDFALNTSEGILYYKRGQFGEYVHRDTIGMDDNEQNKFLGLVEEAYHNLHIETGKKYVLLEDVFELIKLPKLNNHIQWNDVLLADLIKKSNKWGVFGSYEEIYMPSHLPYKDDIDFIEHVITSEFDGVISLETLRLYLAKIRYSSTGELRVFVQEALLNNETSFVLEEGFIIHKNKLKTVRD